MKRFALLPLAIALLVVSCMSGGTDQTRLSHSVKYSTIAESTREGQQSIKGRILLKPPTDNGYIEAIIVTSSGK
jgi:hypothetical protein